MYYIYIYIYNIYIYIYTHTHITSLILLSSKKGRSSEKGKSCVCPLFELKEFLYCECILATLLQNRVQ